MPVRCCTTVHAYEAVAIGAEQANVKGRWIEAAITNPATRLLQAWEMQGREARQPLRSTKESENLRASARPRHDPDEAG